MVFTTRKDRIIILSIMSTVDLSRSSVRDTAVGASGLLALYIWPQHKDDAVAGGYPSWMQGSSFAGTGTAIGGNWYSTCAPAIETLFPDAGNQETAERCRSNGCDYGRLIRNGFRAVPAISSARFGSIRRGECGWNFRSRCNCTLVQRVPVRTDELFIFSFFFSVFLQGWMLLF